MNFYLYNTLASESAPMLHLWHNAENGDVVGVYEEYEALRTALETGTAGILVILTNDWSKSFTGLWEGLAVPPAVIVCSTKAEAAVGAFDCRAADFLLAPFGPEQVERALLRAAEWRKFNETKGRIGNVAAPETVPKCLFVKSDYKIVRISLDEILFIESLGEYIRIHTLDQRLTTLYSLSSLLSILPVERFYRIHRSCIINVDKINFIQNYVVSIGKHQLTISKGQKGPFLEFIEKLGLLG